MTSTSGSAAKIPLQPQPNATFNSPWEAQVFALAVRLQETGILTKDTWTRALASEIQQAGQRNDPDLGDTYYHHWTRALEQVLINSSLVDGHEIEAHRSLARGLCEYSTRARGSTSLGGLK
jgi:nitrile hydratase accessory protein